MLMICCFSPLLKAQILCIDCFNQNDSISDNVNNMIINGGFEDTPCQGWPLNEVFCPNASNYVCDINNWACTGGGFNSYPHIYDVNSNRSVIVEGDKSVYFGNGFCFACSGTINDTSCLNQILCTTNTPPPGYPVTDSINLGGTLGVSLSQAVSGLIIGNTYVLEFWSGGEQFNNLFPYEGLFSVDIGFGDTLLRDPPSPATTGVGRVYVIQFNAINNTQIIKFTNWGHICDSCTELVLDNVRLYPVNQLNPSVAHCSLGINNSTPADLIDIYPNPFDDKITVTTTGKNDFEIIIYDIANKEILRQVLTKPVSEIMMKGFIKGMYIYQVRNKSELIVNGKLIKN